jgi:hypothetical protein
MSGSPPDQAQSNTTTSSSPRPSLTAVAYPEQSTRGPAIGGLSCPPSRLSEISNRPYTATNAPTSLESQLQEAAHTRPVSAATGYAREERSTSNAFSGPLAPPVYFARPNSATSDILDRTPYEASFSQGQHMSTIEEAPRQSSERPETAMLFNRPDTAEILPPRRELPFQRLSAEPLSSGNDGTRPSSRSSTGLMGPPPLPARVNSLRPSSRGATKELELPPLPQPTVIGKTARGKQAMQQPPRTPNQDQLTPLRSKTSPTQGVENQSPLNSSPLSASSPLSFKRSSSTAQALPTPPPLGELSNAAQNLRRTMSQSAPATPPTVETIFQDTSASSDVPSLANTNEHDGLAAYAMQSDEGRRAALNEFIFRHLESDEFLMLVEDMETAWARAALGMQ